jgi:gamma-glutamyl:cysteine ligase YbdK (ATP-grasp superfamily)
MGLPLDRDTFEDHEYARFSERLHDSVEVLRDLMLRDGFGEGPATIGAELELFLTDEGGRPLPVNMEVVEKSSDPRLTIEISRFNLELNLTPGPLRGRPFAALAADCEEALDQVRQVARGLGARVVTIGILPTLRAEHLGRAALTPLPRYRGLSNGIRRLRNGAPFRVAVAREDALQLEWEEVTLEGANTSLQFHLRVPPRDFADAYNAAQLATAPVLGLSANSPFFLNKRLWDETRVAIFRQATDDRGELPADWAPPARVSFGRGWVRKGAWELFSEAVALHQPLLPKLSDEDPRGALEEGRVPRLAELRLHNGTVWTWNRPVYDPDHGGHVRIELRALPAGPSMKDMMANGAFLLGLTLGLQKEVDRLLPGMPFLFARENFHRAARDGIDAHLFWPTRTAPSPRPVPLLDLLPRLCETAARGLSDHGVDAADYEPLLALILDRARARTSGARWQRRALAHFEAQMPREDALVRVLDRYQELSQGGLPVHEWPAG